MISEGSILIDLFSKRDVSLLSFQNKILPKRKGSFISGLRQLMSVIVAQIFQMLFRLETLSATSLVMAMSLKCVEVHGV